MKEKNGKKLKMSGRKFRWLTIPPMILVLLITALLGVVSNMMSSTLDTYLGSGKTVVKTADGTESWDTEYYDVKYSSAEEAKEAAYEVAEKVMEEGTVLMKNNGILPLESGSTLTPFGYSFLNPIYGQLTSGGSGKWTVDPVTPEEALSGTFAINRAAIACMESAGEPAALKEAEGTSEAGASGSMLGGNSYIYEYDPSIYDGVEDAEDTTGLVIISRAGQEGSDKKYDAYEDGTPHYLALSENEKNTIGKAKESCGKVVVVIVSSAVMEVGELLEGELEADAVIWMGHPSERGFLALPKILSGEVTPSGRTVDIYPADLTDDPVYQNFGVYTYSNVALSLPSYTDGGDINAYYVDYQEGVYMGYRYYETADFMDEDFVYGTLDETGAVKEKGAVNFPFGYGLSYTAFDQEIADFNDNGDEITVTVKVTNTGDTYAGKEVVQLYYTAPYTDFDIENKIEKPVIVLAAFDKTELLEPGESEEVQLTFAKEEMASYCYMHENPDGTVGSYVLEEGEYEISLRKNSHDVIDTRSTTVSETFWYDGSDEDHIRTSDKEAQSVLDEEGNAMEEAMNGEYIAATNQFQMSSDYMNDNSSYLSRADWKGTQPQAVHSKELNEEYKENYMTLLDFDPVSDGTFGDVEGSLVYAVEEPVSGEDNGLTLASMRGLAYDDPKWEAYLNQIDWEADKDEITAIFSGSAYTLSEIPSLGMPRTVEMDGANGLKVQGANTDGYDMTKSSSFPFQTNMAATWNVELMYELGAALGQEALQHGITGWYSPGLNLHRSPFCGRIFEYYSEDPVLTGKLCSAVISGAGDQGLVCYIKHFAMNEMETNRSAMCNAWATEQTIRELYLKGFEIAFKEARCTLKYTADEEGNTAEKVIRAATAVMPNQAALNGTAGTVCYELLHNVLRGEWGFRGMVITDYFVWNDDTFRDLCIRTGSDAYLCMHMPMMWGLSDYDSATEKTAMRTSLHNIAYTIANSNAMQNAAPGSTFGVTMPAWKKVILCVQALLTALIALYIVKLVRRIKDEKAHPENYKLSRKQMKKLAQQNRQ